MCISVLDSTLFILAEKVKKSVKKSIMFEPAMAKEGGGELMDFRIFGLSER